MRTVCSVQDSGVCTWRAPEAAAADVQHNNANNNGDERKGVIRMIRVYDNIILWYYYGLSAISGDTVTTKTFTEDLRVRAETFAKSRLSRILYKAAMVFSANGDIPHDESRENAEEKNKKQQSRKYTKVHTFKRYYLYSVVME